MEIFSHKKNTNIYHRKTSYYIKRIHTIRTRTYNRVNHPKNCFIETNNTSSNAYVSETCLRVYHPKTLHFQKYSASKRNYLLSNTYTYVYLRLYLLYLLYHQNKQYMIKRKIFYQQNKSYFIKRVRISKTLSTVRSHYQVGVYPILYPLNHHCLSVLANTIIVQ